MKDYWIPGKKQEKKIVKAIRKAEAKTSGEIRVHIGFDGSHNHLEKAIHIFYQLKMQNTRNRNAVLLHICPQDRTFTIVGDMGIDAVTPDDFWEKIKNKVVKKLKQERFIEGIKLGIKLVGKALEEHFPRTGEEDDINELPDEISYD